MYLCILILPFLSFISCICFGRFIGTSGACFLSTLSIFLAFLLALFSLFETAILGSTCSVHVVP
jgi:NADH:ubiquinone oxidoreductase subunit 5 (subunit L)/multisubunit Na+/H+ antiporter MnhA subunit